MLQGTKDEVLRTKLVQLRAEMAGALATPQPGNAILAALGVGESASDGPEELREKADLLKDAQEKIERELTVLVRRYEVAQRRSDFLRSMHSLESNLFSEDVRRQRTSQLAGTRTAADAPGRLPSSSNSAPAAAPERDTNSASAPASGSSTFGQNPQVPAGPTTPAPSSPSSPAFAASSTSPLADVLVLKDLVDPTTLADSINRRTPRPTCVELTARARSSSRSPRSSAAGPRCFASAPMSCCPPPNRTHRIGVATLLLALAAPSGRAEVRLGRLSLRLETGGEYDSNATRVPEPSQQLPPGVSAEPIVPSFLSRTTTDLDLSLRLSDWQSLALSQELGAKVFAASEAERENVLITSTRLAWLLRASLRSVLEVGADYYDAFQERSLVRRDFRLGTLAPRLHVQLGRGATLTALAGYRAFQFKLDSTQNYWGPVFGLGFVKRWHAGDDDEHEWQFEVNYQLNPRTFQSGNLASSNGQIIVLPGTTRQEQFHFGELRGTYIGPVLVGLSYGLQLNDSTSYGYGLLRHIIALRFASPLALGFRLAFRATLQILQLADPVPVDPLRPDSFENENRSSVEAALERSIGGGFTLVGRYAFYTSVLGLTAPPPGTLANASDFYRHLVFFGVAYQYDR